MNIPVLIASILTFMAFILHTFMGDKELKLIEPDIIEDKHYTKREKWTMARSGWHWISVDLLFATIGLALVNFSDYFVNEIFILQIIAFYFASYGIAWLIGIFISKRFPMNYLKLGQWGLCWVISGLVYWGTLV